jgi:hypothetical protein
LHLTCDGVLWEKTRGGVVMTGFFEKLRCAACAAATEFVPSANQFAWVRVPVVLGICFVAVVAASVLGAVNYRPSAPRES